MTIHLGRRGAALLGMSLLVAAFCALAIAGALANPNPGVRNIPIAIADLDRGATVHGQHLALGRLLVHRITGQPALRGVVAWSILPSRARVVAGMNDNAYDAGLVVPPDYSARLAALLNPRVAPRAPATLEVLTNPAAGLAANAVSSSILLTAAQSAGTAAARQNALTLDRAHARMTAGAALYRVNPIHTVQTVVEPTPTNTGRGSAPFYLSLMVLAASILGTAMLSQGIDAQNMAAAAQGNPSGALLLWQRKTGYALLFTILAGVIQTLIVAILGVPASSWVVFLLFTVLALLAVAMVTLFWFALAGPRGIVLTILFAIALGVPASGGTVPVQMLSGVFQWLHSWVPLRFIADGYRAIIFFHGRVDAGLNTAVLALVLDVILFTALAAGISARRDRRRKALLAQIPEPVAAH